MDPNKADRSKSPSKNSLTKKTPPNGTHDKESTAAGPNTSQSTPASTRPTEPTPKPLTFKSSPQPPVDERLFAAKNFLADEDPDRCLNFDTKIAQVEELVAQIEKNSIHCDPELFRDVKVKIGVHRDWEARRKTSPYDTGCCEAPLIAPFSTRLISTDTAAALLQEREVQGLATQMRTDHVPFSVNPEGDHAAFLAKMREDTGMDPDEVDQNTNLLWTESRAYLWALRDPASIPHWMNPRNGIPTKGTKAADSSRLQVPDSSTRKSRRPSRGWLPAHVAATEKKVNELLRISAPSREEFALLQELLCPFEPLDLHDLHKQNESFTEAALLGSLSESQQSAQALIGARYNDAYRSWLNSLASHGVYFIIRTLGDPEIVQPGVIYVCDGVMTPEHLDTLEKAQKLLNRLLQNGRMDLTEQESASLDSLMRYSLPRDILEVQDKILQILEVQGANSISSLDQKSQAKVAELERMEQKRKLRWEDDLKRSGGAEFRYLRPAEMKGSRGNILYLPWDLTAIPDVPIQARPDLDLPPHVQKLQDEVNRDLPRNIGLPNIDKGSLEFRRSLEQLVYPDLRDLLTPYSALRLKMAAQGQLNNDEARQYNVLAAAVHPLWDAWWHGLGTKITIKMPRREQQNKSPGVMYCRNPDKPIGEDLDTYFMRKAAAINKVLSRYASEISGTEPSEYYGQLYDLCKDIQYPALKKMEERYQKCFTDRKKTEGERLQHDWEIAFRHWIQSKKGHVIRIKVPNPRIDPDDDPSVVYYRGPLLGPSNFLGLSEDIKPRLQAFQTSSLPSFPADLRSELPPLLQRLIDVHEISNTPQSRTVLEWHLKTFVETSTLPKLLSPTMSRSTPHSPTATTWIAAGNGDGTRNGTENLFLSPPLSHLWRQEHIYQDQFNMDLTPLLPEIRAVESEINRLLALFGGGGLPFYLGDPKALAVTLRHLNEHTRLMTLLRQFWPSQVYERWHRTEKYKKAYRFVAGNRDQASTHEYEETLAAYEQEFLKAHNQWIIELRSTGVHIRTSPEEAHSMDKVTLDFQPGTSLIVTETQPEPIFCVLTPEVITGSEVNTSKLVYRSIYDTPPSSTSANYNAMLRAHLTGLETRVNDLLSKRRSSLWTWNDSETLLGDLRAFMPPSLAELESEFGALDEKARQVMLAKAELGNWYRTLATWHRRYDSWLDSFPQGGIIIDKGDQIGNQTGVLKLQIDDPSSIQPVSRSKSLPVHLKSHEDLMNRLASDPTRMSDKNRAHFDVLLAPLVRPTLNRFRYLVRDHIRLRICKRSATDTEDEALLETLISLGQTLLKERILQSKATRKIQFLERVPLSFTIEAVDSSGTVIFPIPEIEQEAVVQQMFDQLCASYLDDSKIVFHDIAFRLRTETTLSREDFDFLMQNIPNIAMTEKDTITARIMTLLQPFGEVGVDESQAQKDLAEALVRLCWKQFMGLYSDQERKIWTLLGNPVLTNGTPVLIARRLPGASPLAPPPLVAPPSEMEVNEVEIQINNLIRGEKTNTISKEQQAKLNYLLRALLPPRLRFLKNKIDDLDGKYLATSGLNMMDSLEFADAQDQFEPQFEKWKQEISDLGIILDSWMSTPEAIGEACSRARQWKEFMTKPDGTTNFGNISNRLEDVTVRKCQEIYAAFRQLVENGCRNPVKFADQLLLHFAPTDITNQINQIMAQTQLAQESSDDEKTSKVMMVHTMKDQLMKSYVRWLTSLTPMQRQTYGQGRMEKAGPVNFTPKAELRGIRRAAIELALNLLATNQEQHRPQDRFRMVDLPPKVQPPEKEAPFCLPLNPEVRPLEQDPLEYVRKLLAFRRWRDYDYNISRARTSTNRSGLVPAPENFNGPTSVATVDDVHVAARTQLNDLASIQKRLIEAEKTAPRPLLEQLLLLVDAGLNNDQHLHELYDDEKLTSYGVDLLDEIAGESWDETRQEYDDEIPGVQNTPDDRGQLEEFERDMEEITELPLWEAAPDPDDMDDDDPLGRLIQTEYDPTVPSRSGMMGDEVRQATGNRRVAKTDGSAGIPHLWDLRTVTRYLRAMVSAGRIHVDDLPSGDILVSRIPLSGHPENKYVVSRAAASTSPGIFQDKNGQLQVRYDASGRIGSPILQPNKFHYLQRLAFRLGRDLKKSAKALAEEKKLEERVHDLVGSRIAAEAEMQNILPADRSEEPWVSNLANPPPRSITLQRMAQDLHKIAPDLAKEAGFQINSPTEIDERQAATLLQMQILEEASNNWEFKFPEKEHVWGFASNWVETTTKTINGRSIQGRPRLKQFFHMRRFPLCCQSTETKTIFKQTGPTIQEKVEPIVRQDNDEDTQDQRKIEVRHIKGREPYFSLGESAYERAFLSWRMEQELKDVPEFQTQKKKRHSWLPSFFRQAKEDDDDQEIRRDRYPLPSIPSHWVPDSVSVTQKRAHVLELAKRTPAFPNPEILEYYHTPEEIRQIKMMREWEDCAMKRRVADAAVEKYTGKKFANLTQEELADAYRVLGIDPRKGVFVDDRKAGMGQGKKRQRTRDVVSESEKRTRFV